MAEVPRRYIESLTSLEREVEAHEEGTCVSYKKATQLSIIKSLKYVLLYCKLYIEVNVETLKIIEKLL